MESDKKEKIKCDDCEYELIKKEEFEYCPKCGSEYESDNDGIVYILVLICFIFIVLRFLGFI